MGGAERLLIEETEVSQRGDDRVESCGKDAAGFVKGAVPTKADAGTAAAAKATRATRKKKEDSGGGGAGTDGAAPKGDEGAGAAPSDCKDDGEATKGVAQTVVTATAAKARTVKRATRMSKGGSSTDAANGEAAGAGTTAEGDAVLAAPGGGVNHGAAAVGSGDAVREGAAATTGHARGAILGTDEGSREQLAVDELRAIVALEATGGGKKAGCEDKRGRIREYAAQSFLGANLCAVTEAGLAGVSQSWERDQRWNGWGFAISKTLSYRGNTLLLSWDADRFTRLEPERKGQRWDATSLAGASAVKLLDNVTGVVLWHVGAHLERNVERRAEQCMRLENIAEILLEEVCECSADALLLSADLNEDLPMAGAQRAARYPSLPSFAANIKEPTVGKEERHRRVIDQIMTHDASLRLAARGAHVFQELGGAQEWLDHNPITVRLDHVE
jgi:hypothetical protein